LVAWNHCDRLNGKYPDLRVILFGIRAFQKTKNVYKKNEAERRTPPGFSKTSPNPPDAAPYRFRQSNHGVLKHFLQFASSGWRGGYRDFALAS
jgi:hypothetical protein